MNKTSSRNDRVEFGIVPYTLDDDVLAQTARDGASRVQVYTVPQPLVVLGRGSDPEAELRLENCRADRVPLTRRRGGGCAVVLDPGVVLVAIAVRAPGIGNNKAHFDRLTDWMVEGLDSIGITNIKGDGISDLVLDDRKVAGSCIYRRKDLLLYSASLLVKPDLDGMERYLAHPPREPEYRRGRTHRDFVRGLADGRGETSVDDFARALRSALSPILLDG